MAFCKSLSHSKMHFNGNFMSRGVKMDVCGLDHSGSQPFNYRSKLVKQVWSRVCGGFETGLSGKDHERVKVIAVATVATEPVIRGMKTCFSPQ